MQRTYFSVTAREAGQTVLTVMRRDLGFSSSMISRLKRRPEGITVNGRRVYVTYVLRAGDFLAAETGDEDTGSGRTSLSPGFGIPYEDEYLMIVNKPAQIAVQPVREENETTLEDLLREYLGSSAVPHPVSRLDRGTSGLMTVAKSGYVHELLKRELHTPFFQKEYRAVCEGELLAGRGYIQKPIGFTEGSTYARCVRGDGAASLTGFEVLKRCEGYTCLRLIPYTGRTHQLRVHMASVGHPLLGDWLYGKRCEGIDRPLLHSAKLLLRHPVSGVLLEIGAPLPQDMLSFFDGCDNYI